jgi:hypothetical protein
LRISGPSGGARLGGQLLRSRFASACCLKNGWRRRAFRAAEALGRGVIVAAVFVEGFFRERRRSRHRGNHVRVKSIPFGARSMNAARATARHSTSFVGLPAAGVALAPMKISRPLFSGSRRDFKGSVELSSDFAHLPLCLLRNDRELS